MVQGRLLLAAALGAAGLTAPGCRSGIGAHGTAHRPQPNPSAVRPFRMGRPDLVLLVTGGTNGRLEVCNCAGPMPGGLARRSGLVMSYRAVFDRTFLLDISDAFGVQPQAVRNPFLLRGYRRLGYDALVLGHHEWAAYPQPLTAILDASPVPCVSTTVQPKSPPNGWAAAREITARRGPVKLAVLSHLTRESMLFFTEEALDRLKFSPTDELVRQVERLQREHFVVVVVVPMFDPQAVAAAVKAVPADLFFRAHTTRSKAQVMRVAGRPVVKIGGRETVGAVALKVRDGRIEDLELRLEVVDTRWPLDKRLIQVYQAYAHAAMRAALDAKRKAGLDYMPSKQCGACHKPQYESWRRGKHAMAYETLVREGRTGDPNCLMCHTSGFGTNKGFYTIEKTPQLAGVNCQNCHRFNDAEHQLDGEAVAFTFPHVKEDICTSCHTPVTDPRFNYKAKLPKGRCPRGSGE